MKRTKNATKKRHGCTTNDNGEQQVFQVFILFFFGVKKVNFQICVNRNECWLVCLWLARPFHIFFL